MPTVESEVTFEQYTSRSSHQRFRATNVPRLAMKVLEEDTRPFNKAFYAHEIHPPRRLMSTEERLNKTYPRCLDMPIRLAGEEWYHLPLEWHGLYPLVKRIIDLEHANNPSVLEYNTYLTVDSTHLISGEQQRNGGLHVDGFQGARIEEKTKITRNYVATNNGGTRYYPQTFDLSLDEARYNLFHAMNEQALHPEEMEENRVYFMDAYTVHESGVANREGLRTFFRLTFDVKVFDRFGNTRNSSIDYDWKMVERNVHGTLLPPPQV